MLPDLSAAFDRLGMSVQMLRAEAGPRQVHIATLPAIAQLWLSPRLPAIRAALPGVTISITALERPPNLKRAPYDLSLFFRTPDLGRQVASDVVFPVCAPHLAEGLRRPRIWRTCPA
ncbi:hypothetical protein [Frigidibacter mobilis]|uniref:LysR family transcriptional regulator n=1 Tax=Frigidibacter mobilis TaxID=1335048 RepID=A0A159YYH4_9RHOB|nr:hypothetical protein [Frigidibacter mobilis]AMY67461.1 LysR family transcriptional regulator [Frigidibacter mobilis]